MSLRLGGGSQPEIDIELRLETKEAEQAAKTIDTMVEQMQKAAAAGNEKQFRALDKQLSNLLGKKSRVDYQLHTKIIPDKDGMKQRKAAIKELSSETLRALTKEVRMNHNSASSLRQQVNTANQKKDAIQRVVGQTKILGMTIDKINPKWKAAQREVDVLKEKLAKAEGKPIGSKVLSMFNKFNQFTMAVQGGIMAVQALNGVLSQLSKRQKEIQAFKLTFENIGVSAEGQDAILKSAIATSLTYGQTLNKIETAWKRLGPAINAAGGSLGDTQLAIESISARTTMLGLSTEQTGRYIEAFAQVMGKGRLQSEELNQQFAELDGALRGQLEAFFEAEHGINDFDAALRKGEISSKMFLDAMNAISENARNNIARDFNNVTQSIQNIGEKGGPTLQQLQNQLMTLQTIGLTEVGKTLARLGKSLLGVQSSFVQMFTHLATEAPGLAAIFERLGEMIGFMLEVPLKMLLLLFHRIMQFIGLMGRLAETVNHFIPIMDLLTFFTRGLTGEIDKQIDAQFRLSEATTGSTDAVVKFEQAQANLLKRLHEQEISYEKYLLLLEKEREERKKNQALKDYDTQREKLSEMIDLKKEAIEREEQLAERTIDAIELVGEIHKEEHEKQVASIKERGKLEKEAIEARIKGVKDFYEKQSRFIEDAQAAIKEERELVKRAFEDKKVAMKAYYEAARAEEDKRHQQAMAALRREKREMDAKHVEEMGELDSGPEQERLNMLKSQELQRRLFNEKDAYKKQELKAEIEAMKLEEEQARLKKEQAEEEKALRKREEAEQKRHAEEKKRLDEEEKLRQRQMAEEQKKIFRDLADSLRVLADTKKENDRAEKDALKSLKETKEANAKAEHKLIEGMTKAYDAADKKRQAQIAKIQEKLKQEKRIVEDIEYALKKDLPEGENAFAASIDAVTNGALQRQLDKVLQIKSALNSANTAANELEQKANAIPDNPKEGKGYTPPKPSSSRGDGRSSFVNLNNSRPGQRMINPNYEHFFTGGPMVGGQKAVVNELGQEGFLSKSGKLSAIKAPSWGTWRAPSSGTVIPAHLWSQIAASSQPTTGVSPKGLSGLSAGGRSVTTSTVSGDTNHIVNHMTIQSSSPSRAASDMLVAMARLKRRRYS